jgi:integrase/recombinase XerC
MEKEIEEFIHYLQYEKHFSAHTQTGYEHDLSEFNTYVKMQFEVSAPQQITHQQIRSWIVELMGNNLDPKSIARKLSALRSFFKFLLKEGRVKQNPVAKVQAPKISKKLPSFVEETHLNKLFDLDTLEDGSKVFPETYEGQRNRLMLLLFYTCGIRLSELIGLKTYDVNFSRQTIKVLGKRNKERIIPITKELSTELQEYLKIKAQEGLENEFLFVLSSNQKLYPKLVYNVVKSYLSMVTSIEKRSPHVLRHTFATHLLNKGADLNAIKELLGHASLAATQVYTHNSIERLKNIHKTRHPRA